MVDSKWNIIGISRKHLLIKEENDRRVNGFLECIETSQFEEDALYLLYKTFLE